MSSNGDGRRSSIRYVLEAAAAIAITYFLFGGSRWSPAFWAAFAVVLVWIVVMHVRRDAGLETEEAFSRWQSHVLSLAVVASFAGALWRGSLWLLGFAAILGWFWVEDYRSDQRMNKKRAERMLGLQRENRDDRPDHNS